MHIFLTLKTSSPQQQNHNMYPWRVVRTLFHQCSLDGDTSTIRLAPLGDRFEAYIYGRDRVSIESDHKLLEMIVLKPLSSVPKWFKRILLQLQKYTLDVKYKKREHMYLADTLSRAYIPEINVCEFVHEL